MVRTRRLLLSVRPGHRQRVRVEGRVERHRRLPAARQPRSVRGRLAPPGVRRPRVPLPPGKWRS